VRHFLFIILFIVFKFLSSKFSFGITFSKLSFYSNREISRKFGFITFKNKDKKIKINISVEKKEKEKEIYVIRRVKTHDLRVRSIQPD